MKDFEKIKDKICFSLINREANQEMLKEHPYIEVLDLAMLFYYKRAEGFKEGATTIICERDREGWGVTLDKLREIAYENTIKLLPPVFQTIEQVIGDIAKEEDLPAICEEEPKERMYVLTNEEKYLGAGTIFYPDILKKIHMRLGVNYFVIPSSIHEVIIMPNVGSVTAANLQSLVVEMNEQFLEAAEVLSNNIYHYDSESDELVMV